MASCNWNIPQKRNSERYRVKRSFKEIKSEVAIQVQAYPQHLPSSLTLDTLIGDAGMKLSNEYRERVLLQIDYCLLELEQEPDLCSVLFAPSNIIIKKVIEKVKGDVNSCGVDIKELANIYCFVLTGKELNAYPELLPLNNDLSNYCDDPHSARDLIDCMKEEDFTLKDILSHPFHWSSREKIDFICQVYEHISPKCQIENKPSLREKTKRALKKFGIDDSTESIITTEGWIDKLKLSENAIEQINNGLEPENKIPTETIYDLAFLGNPNGIFDRSSVFDLIRFFRNNYTHFWENDNKVQRAFGDCIDGYWEFYSVRFPKLLIHLYRKMKGSMNYEVSAAFQHLPEN